MSVVLGDPLRAAPVLFFSRGPGVFSDRTGAGRRGWLKRIARKREKRGREWPDQLERRLSFRNEKAPAGLPVVHVSAGRSR